MAVESVQSVGRFVEPLTVVLGVSGAIAGAIHWGWQTGLGVAIGSTVSLLNFRWLKAGVGAMARTAVADAQQKVVRVPKNIYIKFIGRYVLMLVVLYVILTRSLLPAGGVLAGLFAAVAAVLLDMIYNLVRGLSASKA
ncbi:MAG TPA: ATP synthase subunit I [Candidatus Acidoferrum sp.]|nr:ATP synthase subunit I [Candidatus Acidoferrum sp.]